MRARRTIACLFLLAPALASVAFAAIKDPVRVEQGLLSGARGANPGVRVYKGIPFAAPPVGDLRWKPPQNAASWQGVRQATEFGPSCMQQIQLPPSISEDCLYLNVWTTAKSARDRLPVMVWIYGGGFVNGSSSEPEYDGENLARKGVVLVSINYRLGILGFLSLPELAAESEHHSSGNYGLLDQVAALKWVKKNIENFGGDPNRVTIFGQSNGGGAVNLLTASPLASGLFQRAIGESGAFMGLWRKNSPESAENRSAAFVASLGTRNLKVLRSMPAVEIMKAQPKGNIGFSVDGWFLPQEPYAIYAQGKQNDVALITGSNSDEASRADTAKMKAEDVIRMMRDRYGRYADEYLKVYPAGSDEEARKSFFASLRDVWAWNAHTWARLQTKTGHHSSYRYYFTRWTPGPDRDRLRAYHGAELPYVFRNFAAGVVWEDTDRKLSEVISSYWVNFAATGNPNGKGLVPWPAYTYEEGKEVIMELGDEVHAEPLLYKERMDVLDVYNGWQLQQAAVEAPRRRTTE